MESIGACEAKIHLSRLLERIMRGESLTITRHGRPVARLVPVDDDDRDRALRASRRILERQRAESGGGGRQRARRGRLMTGYLIRNQRLCLSDHLEPFDIFKIPGIVGNQR